MGTAELTKISKTQQNQGLDCIVPNKKLFLGLSFLLDSEAENICIEKMRFFWTLYFIVDVELLKCAWEEGELSSERLSNSSGNIQVEAMFTDDIHTPLLS